MCGSTPTVGWVDARAGVHRCIVAAACIVYRGECASVCHPSCVSCVSVRVSVRGMLHLVLIVLIDRYRFGLFIGLGSVWDRFGINHQCHHIVIILGGL